MVGGGLLILVQHMLVLINSRIAFYERGIVYHKAIGVKRIPAEEIRSIRHSNNHYGNANTWFYLYLSHERVLFPIGFFSNEVKTYLLAYTSQEQTERPA